jgi:hypothetical protein
MLQMPEFAVTAYHRPALQMKQEDIDDDNKDNSSAVKEKPQECPRVNLSASDDDDPVHPEAEREVRRRSTSRFAKPHAVRWTLKLLPEADFLPVS